ncbi:hypothetical protein H0H81_003336 [Sphagnurus paluster]|uniref:DUF6589 domain-containing protein n=1 Tax=Sphagnurus paluster TaxID=117069 RepID=A0A9P7GF99_9AGAR|nr:hypothetical protein H0H81_003336 [Sphagnurus paluster]
MLHVLHNLVNVWSKELRHAITQNWLINPSGRANVFVEIDLVQEHLNFWIKKIYKADGDAHSWNWLALISPCVDVLRHLAVWVHDNLGTAQGARHTTPDLEKDILTLMALLKEYKAYMIREGRILDPQDSPIVDALSTGAASLTHGASSTPIDNFNILNNFFQECLCLTPISTLIHALDSIPVEEYISTITRKTPNATALSIKKTTDINPSLDGGVMKGIRKFILP